MNSKKVLQRDANTNEILGYYLSIKEAALKTGITSGDISRVCHHKGAHITAGGYKWEFTEEHYSCKWGKWWKS